MNIKNFPIIHIMLKTLCAFIIIINIILCLLYKDIPAFMGWSVALIWFAWANYLFYYIKEEIK